MANLEARARFCETPKVWIFSLLAPTFGWQRRKEATKWSFVHIHLHSHQYHWASTEVRPLSESGQERRWFWSFAPKRRPRIQEHSFFDGDLVQKIFPISVYVSDTLPAMKESHSAGTIMSSEIRFLFKMDDSLNGCCCKYSFTPFSHVLRSWLLLLPGDNGSKARLPQMTKISWMNVNCSMVRTILMRSWRSCLTVSTMLTSGPLAFISSMRL